MKTIETIQTVETAIAHIPVKNLVISPLNVPKKQGTGIEELAALIGSKDYSTTLGLNAYSPG